VLLLVRRSADTRTGQAGDYLDCGPAHLGGFRDELGNVLDALMNVGRSDHDLVHVRDADLMRAVSSTWSRKATGKQLLRNLSAGRPLTQRGRNVATYGGGASGSRENREPSSDQEQVTDDEEEEADLLAAFTGRRYGEDADG